MVAGVKLILTTVTGETISPSLVSVSVSKTYTVSKLGVSAPGCFVLLARCRLFLSSLQWAVRRPVGGERAAVMWAGLSLLTNSS